MGSIGKWFPPLCGVIAVVLGVVGTILFGQGQDARKKTAAESVNDSKAHAT